MVPDWTKFLQLKAVQAGSLVHKLMKKFDGGVDVCLDDWAKVFTQRTCFTDFADLCPAVQTRIV